MSVAFGEAPIVERMPSSLLLDSASQAARLITSMIALRPSQSCPSSTPYHSVHRLPALRPRPPGHLDQGIHARRTSSISGLSPIAVIVAHPLAGGCGPFAVSRPTNSREHERIASHGTQCLRGLSPVFARVRGSLRQSGRPVKVGFPMRFLGRLQRICNGHTGLMPGSPPAQAGCMPCRTGVRCTDY